MGDRYSALHLEQKIYDDLFSTKITLNEECDFKVCSWQLYSFDIPHIHFYFLARSSRNKDL